MGAKCLHLSAWAGIHVPAGALVCFSVHKTALRSYRLAEGKLSVWGSRKHLELLWWELRAGQRLHCLTVFPGSEVEKLGAGFKCSDSPNKFKLKHNVGTYEGVGNVLRELLCLYLEILALEKTNCCQTTITDVLLAETACCGLRSLRVHPLSCAASCSKADWIDFFVCLSWFCSHCTYTADICRVPCFYARQIKK